MERLFIPDSKLSRFSVRMKLVVVTCVTVCFLVTSVALAQFRYKGEVEAVTTVTVRPSTTATTVTPAWLLRGHVEADYALDALSFRLVLDPAVSIQGNHASEALIQAGVTEAYARYTFATTDVSAGIERLPLETARLSVPFSIEPRGKALQPLGLPGVRASIYLRDWRLRPAFLYDYDANTAGILFSAKRTFDTFDLEAHALYMDGVTFGIGGSGLANDLVVYGEAWLLTQPLEARGSIGLNGYWGNNLWTTELAYAPAASLSDTAYPQVLAQLSILHDATNSTQLNSSLGIYNNSLLTINTVQYTQAHGDYQLNSSAGFQYVNQSASVSFGVGVTAFF